MEQHYEHMDASETTSAESGRGIQELILITNNIASEPEPLPESAVSALTSDMSLRHIESTRHAAKVLDELLEEAPRTLRCIYQLDNLHFTEMRSSILLAGILALAAQAGHQAIIAPISSQLPPAHWRSEFIFRAVRGIRLIRPQLTELQVFYAVTQAIHFYAQARTANSETHSIRWRKIERESAQMN
jgi:hypothetical protein